MGFERTSFTRKTGLRDAKLVVIATEGEKTEKQYFDSLVAHERYRNSKIHVEVLEKEPSKSDPLECIATLNKFKRKYTLNKDDELWLVCDVDRWGDKKLSSVSKLCRQKNYKIAVSNPCFETWLLLHLISWNAYSKEQQNNISKGCNAVSGAIKNILGSYNKSNINISDFISGVENAGRESKILDNPNELWPTSFGSKVFLLINTITSIQ